MSDDENMGILILETENKILNAQAAKGAIQLRVAKRERDNKADVKHIAAQDEIISVCTEKIRTLKEQGGGK